MDLQSFQTRSHQIFFYPPKEIRALREISRYRYKLVGMRSSERNRYQNCMTVSNIGIGSVFLGSFWKICKSNHERSP